MHIAILGRFCIEKSVVLFISRSAIQNGRGKGQCFISAVLGSDLEIVGICFRHGTSLRALQIHQESYTSEKYSLMYPGLLNLSKDRVRYQ